MTKRTLPAAVMAAFLAMPLAASAAAVDYFLKIDGVEGESVDAGHKGEIDVESWSWGAASTSQGSATGGAGAGKTCAGALNFTKKVDKASGPLMANAISGMVIKSAVLTARKAGERPLEYIKVTLTDVLVSSYQAAGSTASLPTEQVSLNFTKMTFEYKTQKADGSAGDTTTAAFQPRC